MASAVTSTDIISLHTYYYCRYHNTITLITIADVYEDSQDIFVDDLDNQDAVLPCATQMAH